MDPRFTYASATKNDFVMVDDPEGALTLDEERVRELAGAAGTDGVIRAVRTRAINPAAGREVPEWFMDYRNADGSIAQMCGNGVRAFAAFLHERSYVAESDFAVMTRAGVRTVEILAPGPEWNVRVGMGPAAVSEKKRKVLIAGRELDGIDVSVGNPHVVAELPSDLALDNLDLSVRPTLDPEPQDGANIEFVHTCGQRHVAFRVFERGVGETLSCGTGATAVAAVAARLAGDQSGEPWRVDVRGGTLQIGWKDDGDLTLAGPAQLGPLHEHPAFEHRP